MFTYTFVFTNAHDCRYGTESGTSETLAVELARQLSSVVPTVLALDEVPIESLASYEMLLFVTSTFGDGQFPRNALKFVEELEKLPPDELRGTSFSVCGLGSRIYANFCAAAVKLDRLLAKAGSSRIVPLHKADELQGQMETFKTWQQLISRILGVDAPSGKQRELTVVFNGPGVAAQSKLGTPVPLVRNDELLREVAPASRRSTRRIAFAIAGTGLSYETGDHLGVYPCNDPREVERLAGRLQLPVGGLDESFHVETVGEDGVGDGVGVAMPFATPTTVRQLLTDEVDLLFREPFDPLLKRMAKRAKSMEDRNKLEGWLATLAAQSTLAEKEAMLELKVMFLDNFLFVVDVLEAVSSVTLELLDVVELFPRMKQRFYSISSASVLRPDEIHLTAGVVEVVTDAGKRRPGLCSTFLAELNPATKPLVRVFVRTSEFRLPETPDTPLIMVGPGTGLAPMIAFLEQRQVVATQQAAVTLGAATLYFGCRGEHDLIYGDELKQWHTDGVISRLEVAYSRVPGKPKTYVQHLISQQGDHIWELLTNGAVIFICGDASMADDVGDALRVIAMEAGGLSRLQAGDFIDELRGARRLQLDVWGATLNYKDALKLLRQKRKSVAAAWFNAARKASAPAQR
jgi:sulfite reductase alpha subunit-like flavoprotein